MKKLTIEKTEILSGGDVDKADAVIGTACGLEVSGGLFGGFGIIVTGLIFGPTCILGAVVHYS